MCFGREIHSHDGTIFRGEEMMIELLLTEFLIPGIIVLLVMVAMSKHLEKSEKEQNWPY